MCEVNNTVKYEHDRIRQKQKTLKDLDAAVDAAIEEMPEDFVIRAFLLQNKAEVKGMFLTEYDQDKVLAQERREVERMTHEQVAKDMLMDNYPLSAIAKISRLSEDTVRKLASSLEVIVS